MSVTSSVTALRLTCFQAEKLSQVSGSHNASQRQSSPYRITTFKGPELGLIGKLPAVLYKLHEIDTAKAANGEDLPAAESNSLLQRIKRRCLRR